MRTVVGDRVIDHVVLGDPVEHPAHVVGAVSVVEQPPLGERDRLAVRLGEVGLRLKPVRLLHVVGEGLARGQVVAVHADDVDDVVARVATRPGDRVVSSRRREVEAEPLSRRRSHRRDDAPPVALPRVGIGPAPVGVGAAVHLPAEHDDGVGGVGVHQLLRQALEERVEGAVRARAEQRGHLVVGHLALVRGDHRHVQRQDPARLGGAPARPRLEDEPGALQRPPDLPRQIGTADRHLGAQPRLEAGHLLGPSLVGGEKDTERGGLARVLVTQRTVDPRARGKPRHSRRSREYREKTANVSIFGGHYARLHMLSQVSPYIPRSPT